jgi:hypothetical protein
MNWGQSPINLIAQIADSSHQLATNLFQLIKYFKISTDDPAFPKLLKKPPPRHDSDLSDNPLLFLIAYN